MMARQPEVLRLDLPARFTYLHLLGDSIADLLTLVDGVDDAETLVYNIQLAAHEVCTNIVNHAYNNSSEGRIAITLTLGFEPPHLMIDLHDTGRTFDPDSVAEPNLDEVRIHGYGLFLIRHLMDTVTYTPEMGHNRWCLVKNLQLQGV